MRRSIVPGFVLLLFQLIATPTSSAADSVPAIYAETDWAQAAAIAVTSGTDRVPYVDQGALDMPAGDHFGSAIATWTDGVATVLVVGSPDEDGGNGAAYVFRRTEKTAPWRQEARLTTGASGAYFFGTSVAVSGDVVVVGAPYYKYGSSTGAVLTYVRNPTTAQWALDRVQSIDGAYRFGSSLAFDGVWLFVGAPTSNFVEVYRRDGSSWTNIATLMPPDALSTADFGQALSLDHNRVLIGAPYDDSVAHGTGSAYLFDYDPPTASWQLEHKLVNGISGEDYANFGSAVALLGNSAIVAANNDGDGRVISFRNTPSIGWGQRSGELQSMPGDYFGHSLAYDGSLLAVGSYVHGSSIGGIYLYSGSAASWTAVAELDANGEDDAFLGSSVAIVGNEVFGGAENAEWAGVNHGSVDVFEAPSGTWGKTNSIHAAGDENEQFGTALAVSGSTVVATAPNADALIVYSRDGTGHWQAEATLPADGFAGSKNVALEGDTLIIGTPHASFGSHIDQGAAYVYVRQSTPTGVTWVQQAFLADPSGLTNDELGAFVALSGNTALIGAPGKNGNTGSAYVFVRSGTLWTQQALLTVAEKVERNAGVGAFWSRPQRYGNSRGMECRWRLRVPTRRRDMGGKEKNCGICHDAT